MLAYLNYHTYIVFVVVSLLSVNWHMVAISLFVCSCQLNVGDYYYYYCLSDNQRWPCTKVHRRSRQLTIRSVYWQRWVTVSGIISTCISCIWGGRMLYKPFYAWVYVHICAEEVFWLYKHCDVFFTIMMLMLVCHNCDSYSGFKKLHKLLIFLSMPKGVE